MCGANFQADKEKFLLIFKIISVTFLHVAAVFLETFQTKEKLSTRQTMASGNRFGSARSQSTPKNIKMP